MPQQTTGLRDRILDTALELAEASSWERLRLHRVAEALDITLDEVRQHFRQKDDLAEAWFDRADRSMLVAERSAGFLYQPLHVRLGQVIADWLAALAPHRRVTREMLACKLEPGHIHLQVPGILRVSRTVQWFREAACQDSTGLRRILDETALTAIYLAVFARWLFDDSANGVRSRQHLDTALRRCFGTGAAAVETPPGPEGTSAGAGVSEPADPDMA
jgi:AcrR family transcriptional regulator